MIVVYGEELKTYHHMPQYLFPDLKKHLPGLRFLSEKELKNMRLTSGWQDSQNCCILQAFRNCYVDVDCASTKAVIMLKNESVLSLIYMLGSKLIDRPL